MPQSDSVPGGSSIGRPQNRQYISSATPSGKQSSGPPRTTNSPKSLCIRPQTSTRVKSSPLDHGRGCLGNESGVGTARVGGDALELGVGVEIDVVEPKVAAVVEGQAPLAIRGDAPAEIALDGDAACDGLADLVDVRLEVVGAGHAGRAPDAAVLDDDDRLAGKLARGL